jgi:hypothetical protein
MCYRMDILHRIPVSSETWRTSAVFCSLRRCQCAWQHTAPELPVYIVHQYQDAWPSANRAESMQYRRIDGQPGLTHAHCQHIAQEQLRILQDRCNVWMCWDHGWYSHGVVLHEQLRALCQQVVSHPRQQVADRQLHCMVLCKLHPVQCQHRPSQAAGKHAASTHAHRCEAKPCSPFEQRAPEALRPAPSAPQTAAPGRRCTEDAMSSMMPAAAARNMGVCGNSSNRKGSPPEMQVQLHHQTQ